MHITIAGTLLLVELVLAMPQVRLGRTIVKGTSVPQAGLEFFGGIPYAEPPVGNLRFAPPKRKTSLDMKSFNASNFGPACPQDASNVSEDCLTINILRPTGINPKKPVPVMAWIYGGGFFAGSASQFNASAFVSHSVARRTPIIYVNFNYRVGPFGFPQGNEAGSRGALNLGLKDQLAALEWIQDHIGLFGGNKHEVTVFGESAGAISLAIHFLDPKFSNLARAAIFESGSAASALLYGPSHREMDWQRFVNAVPECAKARPGDTFGCLKSANFSSLLPAATAALGGSPELFPFIPVIDGPGGVLPDLPSQLWAKGKYARMPFISGTNKDEGTAFTPATFDSSAQLKEWLIVNNTPSALGSKLLSQVADRTMQLYPDVPALGCPFDTGNDTFGLSSQYKRAAAVLGDVYFHAQRRAWMQAATRHGVKIFGYLFTDPQPTLSPSLGVTHAAELPYVYGRVVNGSNSANQLSRDIIDYWISFATSLDPNDKHGNLRRPRWIQYKQDLQVLLELNGANTRMIPDDYRRNQIDFINSNLVAFHHRRSYDQ